MCVLVPPEVPQNVSISHGRIFITVALHGCGNGCLYCYVEDCCKQQEFLDETSLMASLEYIIGQPSFVPGKSGTLISVCPNTEPFKTDRSSLLVERILRRFLQQGNPVQISTKEIVPASVFGAAEQLCAYEGQLSLFISCCSISGAASFEPGAAPVQQRLKNIERCRAARVASCLYIKPFIRETEKDLGLFADALQAYRPTAACVGIRYGTTTQDSVSGAKYIHPAHPELISSGPDDAIISFAHALAQRTPVPVFYSSTCVSAYARDWHPTPNVWRDYPRLCVNCRPCEEVQELP